MLPILDVDVDLEPLIRENIRIHRHDNLYVKFQQTHKKLALSLHVSIEDTLANQEGRYSPEVHVPSMHFPVCNKHKTLKKHSRTDGRRTNRLAHHDCLR